MFYYQVGIKCLDIIAREGKHCSAMPLLKRLADGLSKR